METPYSEKLRIQKGSSIDKKFKQFNFRLSRPQHESSGYPLTIQVLEPLKDTVLILIVQVCITVNTFNGYYDISVLEIKKLIFSNKITQHKVGLAHGNQEHLIVVITDCNQPMLPEKTYEIAASTFNKDFSLLLEEEETKDITFKFPEQEVRAHKFVLSTRSPVFKQMFDIDMKEKNTGTVEIKDASFGGFYAFLEFIYGDKYEPGDLTKELLFLADKYQVQSLKEKAGNTLLENLSEENAIETLILFDLHQVLNVKRATAKFIAYHSGKIFTEEEKSKLAKSHPHLVEYIQLAIDVMQSM